MPDDERLGRQRLQQPLLVPSATGSPWLAPGRLDGAPALLAVRNTLYPGVLLTAGLRLDVALASDAADQRQVLLVAAGFIGMLLAAAALLQGALVRQARAQEELAESKRTLEQAMASMNDGLLLLDKHQRVLAWNHRYVSLFPWLAPVLEVGVHFSVLARAAADALLPEGTQAERKDWVARAWQPTADGASELSAAGGRRAHRRHRAPRHARRRRRSASTATSPRPSANCRAPRPRPRRPTRPSHASWRR